MYVGMYVCMNVICNYICGCIHIHNAGTTNIKVKVRNNIRITYTLPRPLPLLHLPLLLQVHSNLAQQSMIYKIQYNFHANTDYNQCEKTCFISRSCKN